MSDVTIRRFFTITTIILLIISAIQIAEFPGGMFFSGYCFGIIFILGILIICWLVAFISNLIFKNILNGLTYYFSLV